jgi:hypothetical protein
VTFPSPYHFLKRPAVAIGAVAAIEALVLTLAFAAGAALRSGAAELVRGGMPEDAIVVAASGVAIGPISFSSGSVPAALAGHLREEASVERVLVEEALAVPARISGSLFGHAYGTDLAVTGVEAEQAAWLAPGITAAEFRDVEPVPLLAPRLVLDAYNANFAEANGLPRLTESAFLGRTLTLEAGVSSLRAVPGAEAMRARLAGFVTRRELTLGVIAPLDLVRRVNAAAGIAAPPRRLLVIARTPADGERLAARLRGDGYAVEAPDDRLRNLRILDAILAGFGAATGAALGFLAAVGAFFAAAAQIQARAAEAELMHQIGSSRIEIVSTFVRRIVGRAAGGAFGGGALAFAVVISTGGAASRLLSLPLPAPSLGALLFSASLGALLPALAILAGALLGGLAVIPAWHERGR